MLRYLEKYEAIFSAVAFAEMNEHEAALELSGPGYTMRKKVADLKQCLQRVFAATAFTDVGCHDMAVEMLNEPGVKARKTRSFSRFLEEVGLQGVRFQYVVARI